MYNGMKEKGKRKKESIEKGEIDMGTIKVYSLEYGGDGMCCLVAREGSGYAKGYPIKDNKTTANVLDVTFAPTVKVNRYVYMVACDREGKGLGLFVVACGEGSKLMDNIRNILLSAMLCRAETIFFARNDPKGKETFTEEELEDFFQVKEIVKQVGILAKDYLLLLEYGYLSAEEEMKQERTGKNHNQT